MQKIGGREKTEHTVYREGLWKQNQRLRMCQADMQYVLV